MIGLDTTALIDIYKADKKLKTALGRINEPLSTTIINYQEVIFGLDISQKKHAEEKQFYDHLIDSLILHPLTKESAVKSSHILWKLKKQGKSITPFDCCIAGILLTNGVPTIITRNEKDFKRIQGMKVISY